MLQRMRVWVVGEGVEEGKGKEREQRVLNDL
jgi:hypothetical protein